MRRLFAAATTILLLIPGSIARAAEPSLGAGSAVTLGSSGYHKFALYGDCLWHARRVDPYAWTELSSDNFIRELAFAGGAWKEFSDALRVKGGGGLIFGRIKDLDESSSALLIETGIEKDFEWPTVGAEYRLTSGSIVGPSVLGGGERQVEGRAHGRAPAGAVSVAPPQDFTYSELSGYAKFPIGEELLGLRLTWGAPSYADSFLAETLSLKIPVSKPLSITPAVSLEQGPASNAYFSLSLYYLFR